MCAGNDEMSYESKIFSQKTALTFCIKVKIFLRKLSLCQEVYIIIPNEIYILVKTYKNGRSLK